MQNTKVPPPQNASEKEIYEENLLAFRNTMPLTRCTCKMDQPNRCKYHREHNFDLTSLEILARGRVSPDLLQSPSKRHVSSPSNQQTSSFTFDDRTARYKGQPPKPMNLVTTYQKDFCQTEMAVVNGKSS